MDPAQPRQLIICSARVMPYIYYNVIIMVIMVQSLTLEAAAYNSSCAQLRALSGQFILRRQGTTWYPGAGTQLAT